MFGQIALWLSLLVSALLLPGIVSANSGISNFGVHARTILPYGLGFLLCGYLTLMAAHSIKREDNVTTTLSRALFLLSLLLLGILLTPYSVNRLFDWSHMAVGGLLFMFELAFAAWLVRLRPDNISFALFTAQCLGSAVAALSLLGAIQLMFVGQMAAEIAFGILLVRVTMRITSTEYGQITATSRANDGLE